MKRYVALFFIFNLGCLETTKPPSDAGIDQNNSQESDANKSDAQKDAQREEDVYANLPTAEDCEGLKTEATCYAAGCNVFHEVEIIDYADGVCGDRVSGTVCWVGDGTAIGTTLEYSRTETDGTITVVHSPGFLGVLGWESCLDDCLCPFSY